MGEKPHIVDAQRLADGNLLMKASRTMQAMGR
jgi:hypothetical protein